MGTVLKSVPTFSLTHLFQFAQANVDPNTLDVTQWVMLSRGLPGGMAQGSGDRDLTWPPAFVTSTDDGLVHLKDFLNLQILTLVDTEVTDSGLAHLGD